MFNQPLVSCLCVTKNKLEILKRSIDCFRSQSYPNKELIILKQGSDKAISEYLKELNDNTIIYIEISPNANCSLGDLRNISIENCNGEYFCIWDDDDWQHMNRLKVQVDETLKSHHPASVLTNLLAFNEVTKKSYFTSFRLWEGTVLCSKDLYLRGIKYPSLSKSEDTSFLYRIYQESKILPVVNSVLFIYIYHGNNTWDIDHFNTNIFRQPLSQEASDLTATLLNGTYNGIQASKLIDLSSIPREVNHLFGECLLLHETS